MAEITTADIKKLREITAAGMVDVKKALVEAEGDFEKAIEILRMKGAKDVGKRESRTASNGLVTSKVEGGVGVLVELACETDFVAKSADFQALAATVVDHAFAGGFTTPEALLTSELDGKTVKGTLDDANARMGEKIEVRRLARIEAPYVETYLHKSNPDLPPTLGVLIGLTAEHESLGKEVAQHIAAMAPKFLHRDHVPADVVEGERRLAEAKAREDGKPEGAIPMITKGTVESFFKDFTVLEQAFVKDNKKNVATVLKEAGLEATAFARFKVGQE